MTEVTVQLQDVESITIVFQSEPLKNNTTWLDGFNINNNAMETTTLRTTTTIRRITTTTTRITTTTTRITTTTTTTTRITTTATRITTTTIRRITTTTRITTTATRITITTRSTHSQIRIEFQEEIIGNKCFGSSSAHV